jgi:radical SAM protein with 4Fe4S-binding SPASM domain
VSFNVYFLVPTGRGARLSDLTPAEYEIALSELERLHREYLGRMMVRAKCAPHFMRHVHSASPESPVLNYETRCPCGVQYCRITPDGRLTPCPYLPESAGDLRRSSFAEIWRDAPLFRSLREGSLRGKCGQCEYRKVCGGCRARAFAVEGDVLAADPSCAYEPSGSVGLIESTAPVRYGQPAERSLPWTPEAEARIRRIPSFVRGVVVRRLEDYARRHGRTEVTADLLAEVRRAMPVDFSQRKPFFLDDA